jgi:hypothetical protein
MKDELALFTEGMSLRPMRVPKGCEEYRFAELVIYLPRDWPLTARALDDPKYFWPIEWLRHIARYPHEHKTWLGGRSAVIANGDPPEPLAPNTRLACILAVAEESEFGQLRLPSGDVVTFYTLIPIYTEERDLEVKKGIEHLIRLFRKRGVGFIVDINRPNVAKISDHK